MMWAKPGDVLLLEKPALLKVAVHGRVCDHDSSFCQEEAFEGQAMVGRFGHGGPSSLTPSGSQPWTWVKEKRLPKQSIEET